MAQVWLRGARLAVRAGGRPPGDSDRGLVSLSTRWSAPPHLFHQLFGVGRVEQPYLTAFADRRLLDDRIVGRVAALFVQVQLAGDEFAGDEVPAQLEPVVRVGAA